MELIIEKLTLVLIFIDFTAIIELYIALKGSVPIKYTKKASAIQKEDRRKMLRSSMGSMDHMAVRHQVITSRPSILLLMLGNFKTSCRFKVINIEMAAKTGIDIRIAFLTG